MQCFKIIFLVLSVTSLPLWGATGSRGDYEFRGFVTVPVYGPTGSAGPGCPEAPGPTGASGTPIIGPDGRLCGILFGPTGSMGFEGATGSTGWAPPGPQGPRGAAWGPTGATGAAGPPCFIGATGATGAAGPPCFIAATGATGAAGPGGPADATAATEIKACFYSLEGGGIRINVDTLKAAIPAELPAVFLLNTALYMTKLPDAGFVTLDLSNSELNDGEVDHLIGIIKQANLLERLQVLNLSNNKIQKDGVFGLWELLEKPAFKSLDISGNPIEEGTLRALRATLVRDAERVSGSAGKEALCKQWMDKIIR